MNDTLIRLNPHWSVGKYTDLHFRELLPELLKKLVLPHVHVLTGIRRSGKSSLFRLIVNHLMDSGVNPREILLLNMDEPLFTPVWSTPAEIYRVIEQAEVLTGTKVGYLFLDEVQQVTNWELFVKGAYDTRRFKKIYVTGSTSDLLQRQFATLLSGRYVANVVRPLSLKEVFSINEMTNLLAINARKTEALSLLNNYLVFGGFPEIVIGGLPDDLKTELLHSYYDSIVLKNCIAYNGVRDTHAFYRAMYYLLTNTATPFRYNNLGKALGNSENTVKRYILYAVQAYILSDVSNFSFSVKEGTRPERKVYCADNGLIHAVGLSFSPNSGKLLENAVYNQLLYAGYSNIAFVRKSGECDFVACREDVWHAFQVCYELTDLNRSRELSGFNVIEPLLNIASKTIITYNQKERVNDVEIVPFYEWVFNA
jgi:predicted AAA+ superfamily ATPase